MPGGARGEGVAFEEHYVGAPEVSEVVGDAATDDAAADDDDTSAIGELSGGHGYRMIAEVETTSNRTESG
jgi:hypothetical protein